MITSLRSANRRSLALASGAIASIVMALMAVDSSAQTSGQPAPQRPSQPAAQPRPAQPAQARPPAKAPEKAAAATPDTQPLLHARGASVSTCMPALTELSRLTVDAPHAAVSVWNKSAANDHAFSSIVGLRYANETAPQAVSILTVAPNKAQRCDGSSVQVQPSKLACDAIAKNLTATPKVSAVDMNGVIMVQGDGPLRIALLPTSGNGCAVVGISTYFARP